MRHSGHPEQCGKHPLGQVRRQQFGRPEHPAPRCDCGIARASAEPLERPARPVLPDGGNGGAEGPPAVKQWGDSVPAPGRTGPGWNQRPAGWRRLAESDKSGHKTGSLRPPLRNRKMQPEIRQSFGGVSATSACDPAIQPGRATLAASQTTSALRRLRSSKSSGAPTLVLHTRVGAPKCPSAACARSPRRRRARRCFKNFALLSQSSLQRPCTGPAVHQLGSPSKLAAPRQMVSEDGLNSSSRAARLRKLLLWL